MKTTISFYGSHNGAIALAIDEKVECVMEVERFINMKNYGIAQYKIPYNAFYVMSKMVDWLKRKYNIEEFDECVSMNSTVVYYKLEDMKDFIPAKKYMSYTHHLSHAAGAFYQSPHNSALIFSFDGGGDDGMFNIFHATRELGPVLLDKIPNPSCDYAHIHYDLGFPYMLFGQYLNDIHYEASLPDGNLVYPGKLMGLASYGKVRYDWLPYFKSFYKQPLNGNNYGPAVQFLGKNIGIEFDVENRLTGQDAYDVAATSQRAFEDCFIQVALPYMKAYPDEPICLTGGCALNIILNTRIATEFNRDVFVGPNPNDCGIAVGALLQHIKPEEPVDLTYAGLPLLDKDLLSEYIQMGNSRKIVNENPNKTYFETDISTIVDDLIDGKIIGIARGNSEHGPRALGNRSIVCNPSIPDMKDILNSKVKNREWYRPFAPVVRLEDVNKYFYWDKDARWMSFCPVVREAWREKLAVITHVDNTARVQTVTKEQNEWLYNLLTEFEKATGVGVLLNTSFNVNGRPILSTIKDAMKIFNETRLDALLIEDVYFKKEPFVDKQHTTTQEESYEQ